ncbi:hypothetical protein [Zooshikella ganghwensis]|uniref:Uncharacterized protein n=1 Tax=Zooshikella ganghwensis TaxID=202772 RepID=A0A4P9VHU3_9GAMM|nr:hypothetical protein [Zooshikella ganghwensis]RDH42076.1 hypothetical protein B9G39_00700 [Zooshikella ganghwensis]
MIIQTLSKIIDKTLNDEVIINNYKNFLQSEADQLSLKLRIPQSDVQLYVYRFTLDYVRLVPKFLEGIDKLFKKYHVLDDWLPVLKIIVNFFITPMDLVKCKSDIHKLMLESYLAMRILEEISEFFLERTFTPLLPEKIVYLNAKMHSVIDDSVAQVLDAVVIDIVNSKFPGHKQLSTELQDFLLKLTNKEQELLPKWPKINYLGFK